MQETSGIEPAVLTGTGYGWWLPNDPRGSGSRTIRSDILTELGELHHGRKPIQPAGRAIRAFYAQAADALKHPLLTFDAEAISIIGEAFATVIAEERYTCYACAIMPDHVHILMRKHKHQAEDMVERFMESSRARLIAAEMRAITHPTWIDGHGWKVFLDHPDEIRRTIRYVQRKPVQAGSPAQTWSWVTTYDGWPLHPGHSPNSPYAKRLRTAGRYS